MSLGIVDFNYESIKHDLRLGPDGKLHDHITGIKPMITINQNTIRIGCTVIDVKALKYIIKMHNNSKTQILVLQ